MVVMLGFVPAIHSWRASKGVDALDKPTHDAR
jgi:hypothetical protein